MDGKKRLVIVRRRLSSNTIILVELESQEAFLQYRLQLRSRMQVLRTNQYSSGGHDSLAVKLANWLQGFIQHTLQYANHGIPME